MIAAERISRRDLDRLVEHRRNSERVDRAHGMHLTAVLETNLMSRRPTIEGIGDGDSTVLVEMNQGALARERRGRFVNVEAEALGRRRYID
jgi:hypothetical protein